MLLTVLTGVLSFVGGNVSGIILAIFLFIAAYKIKNKTQKKSNQTPGNNYKTPVSDYETPVNNYKTPVYDYETPVYDYVEGNFVRANSKTTRMELNDAYGSRIPQTTVNSSM